jgi:type II secretory pathway pseudopilin PulG
VELTAVVILLALVAGTATVLFREPYRLARQQATIDRLTFIDQHVRHRAVSHSGELIFNLKSRTAIWDTTESKDEETLLAAKLQIDRIWTLAGGDSRTDEIRIAFHSNETADTYAVRTSLDGASVRWQLFIGLTGQHMEIGNDREAETILRSLNANGANVN